MGGMKRVAVAVLLLALLGLAACGEVAPQAAGPHGDYELSWAASESIARRYLSHRMPNLTPDDLRRELETNKSLLDNQRDQGHGRLTLEAGGAWRSGQLESEHPRAAGRWATDLGLIFLYVHERDQVPVDKGSRDTLVFRRVGQDLWMVDSASFGGRSLELSVMGSSIVYRRVR